MSRVVRVTLAVVAGLAIVVVVYTGVIGVLGSDMAVHPGRNMECGTPGTEFRWAYEAINYDRADDELLSQRNAKLGDCTAYEGTKAGTDVVTDDGIRIAGWYIPVATGAGPGAATVVLVHGFPGNKSTMLAYARTLHERFNLVAFDMRNSGRSTGAETTLGVKEQKDLRAIIDWVERVKHPSHLAVLGVSMGAVTALAEMRSDPRVEAIVLDSMHTRTRYQIEARIAEHEVGPFHLVSYFGTTWAIALGVQIRTGVDIQSIDAEETIQGVGARPVLLIHGTGDTEDLPARTQEFYDRIETRGIHADLRWCAGAGHKTTGGLPVSVCSAAYGGWVGDFLGRALTSTTAL